MERADLATTLAGRMTEALAVGDVALCERLLTAFDRLIGAQALELATAAGRARANDYSARHVAAAERKPR